MNKFFLGMILITSFQGHCQPIRPGCYQMDQYLPLLFSKKVGICTNHTGLIESVHLVDSLIDLNINVIKVFSPEHGFNGKKDAGQEITNQTMSEYEIVSLYGNKKQPSRADMQGLEIMVFDIQDVGARFYTYTSTMTYVMTACAIAGIPLIILDRPNPIGNIIGGPVLARNCKSFVGMHPVPIAHGLTVGEYAYMINEENWLDDELYCDLKIIKIKNWTHSSIYKIGIKPSPNLPDQKSIQCYPSLCLFEQTICSVGRGTEKAFQHIGHPSYPDRSYYFLPRSQEGASNPKYENQKCYGINYSDSLINGFSIQPLIYFYDKMGKPGDFFGDYFHLLAGNHTLQDQIESNMSVGEIEKSWAKDLSKYKKLRKQYLLYPE